MEEATVVNKGDDIVYLPPGFRFHPTDEEIITHYLTEKVKNSNFSASAIGEVDLNKCEPWDLPKRAKMGEKEWYFFCQRDRKYPTGMRTNRATEAGYWKATGKDKEIFRGKNCLVGMKKTLVFYRGRAPKGEKSNWVMHEYRLEGKFNYYTLAKAAKEEWVVCRVFHKSTGLKKTSIHELIGDGLLDISSPPPLMEAPYPTRPGSSSFSNGDNNSDFKGMTNTRSSDGNYFPQYCPTSMVDSTNSPNLSQLPSTSYQTPFNSNLYPQMVVPTNPIFSFPVSPNIPGYLQTSGFGGHEQSIFKGLSARNEAFGMKDKDKQCKVEQFSSNQSMVSLSQETGLSTDVNTTEISSKQEIASNKVFEDLEGPSIGLISDLEFLLPDY